LYVAHFFPKAYDNRYATENIDNGK
jgi:hypothetical protein